MKKIVLIFLLLLLTSFVFFRPLNPDEAFYSISSFEWLHGKIPYVDYLFHQMPLVLPVYSIVSFQSFWSLIFGRLLSYFFYLVSLMLIYKYLLNENKKNFCVFVVFFLFNSFLLNWVFVIKIYTLSMLLLITGIVFIKKFLDTADFSRKYLFSFFAGLFFSLLLLSRIVFGLNIVITVIFIIYYVWKNKVWKNKLDNKLKILFFLFAGLAIPFLIFLFISRNHLILVYLNVVHLNNIYFQETSVGFWQSLISYHQSLLSPQNLILILIIFIARKKFELIEIFIALNFIVFYAAHIFTQMLSEYIAPAIPLLIILAFNRYDSFQTKLTGKFHIAPARFVVIFLIIFILMFPFGLSHFKILITGKEVAFTPIKLNKISNMINDTEGKTILSSWEGYSFYSHKEPLMQDGYVTAYYVYSDIPVDERIKPKFVSLKQYKDLINSRIPDIIVYDEDESRHLLKPEDINKNYEVNSRYQNISIYKRKSF